MDIKDDSILTTQVLFEILFVNIDQVDRLQLCYAIFISNNGHHCIVLYYFNVLAMHHYLPHLLIRYVNFNEHKVVDDINLDVSKITANSSHLSHRLVESI